MPRSFRYSSSTPFSIDRDGLLRPCQPISLKEAWPEVTPEQAAAIDRLLAPDFALHDWIVLE
jgi:hypothetical protein